MLNPIESTIQRYNVLLHQEPWSSISHCIFWILFWTISTPIMIWVLLIQLGVNLYYHYVLGANFAIDPKTKPDVELAVVVTGCDTGFGKDLVWEVARQGFVVFAGCLQESSFEQFQLESHIIPIKMDVTSDTDVQRAAETVSKWLSQQQDEKDPNRKKRYLHALVNNAGISAAGLIDWLDMASFEKVTQVNFFGMVRTVKAFYPIFKDQAPRDSPHYYGSARIINMISAAGLNAYGLLGCPSYEASKNAAEAFTAALRLEMKTWNVHVTAVNPSFHETPMVQSLGEQVNTTWNQLPQERRDEYGNDYFEHFKRVGAESVRLVWPIQIVSDEIVKCLKSPYPPAQLLIGLDCRFAFVIFRLLPVWARTFFFQHVDFYPVKPAKMRR